MAIAPILLRLFYRIWILEVPIKTTRAIAVILMKQRAKIGSDV